MKYQVKDTGKQDGWAPRRLWLSVLISLNGKKKRKKALKRKIFQSIVTRLNTLTNMAQGIQSNY